MLKGVIIGFGTAAETAYLPALAARKEELDIRAVCDPSAERLEKAGELLGGEPFSLAAGLQPAENGEAGNREAAADCQLHFSGATAHIHLSAKNHADRTIILVCGNKGVANLDEELLTLDLKGLAPEAIKFKERLSAANADSGGL